MVKGFIKDASAQPLSFCNVFAMTKDSANVINYCITDDNGYYEIKIEEHTHFIVRSSSLGYTSKEILIEATESVIPLDLILEVESSQLNEVVVRASKPISVKGDTVIFDAKFFADGSEQQVEDLLKKIPGLEVDDQGAIRVHGQEVEKVMVEGDDFFEGGYKTLTKNMPAQPIEKVEVLQNYSNNHLLKGIENSEKVALNLTLEEDAKNVWFGNANAGSDVTFKKFYESGSNAFSFGKKNKYYLLSDFNNIGYDPTGDAEYFINSFRNGDLSTVGNNQRINNLLETPSESSPFGKNQGNFNNSKLVSLNSIFNPTEKIKIKSLLFFNNDLINFSQNTTEHYLIDNADFTNRETYSLETKKNIGLAKIDASYNISKNKTLVATTKYSINSKKGMTTVLFNDKNSNENIDTDNNLLDQQINYSNKFKDNKIFLIKGRFLHEKNKNLYKTDQSFSQHLFSSSPSNNNGQQVNHNEMYFGGIEAHLLDRKENNNLLELQFGNQIRYDKLNTRFTLLENDVILENPEDFQNNNKYLTNNLYAKAKYGLKLNDFFVTGKIGIHQISNQFKTPELIQQQYNIFINPKLEATWTPNKKQKIIASYSYNSTNAPITDMYENYALTGSRSFSKGTTEFGQLNTSTILINHQLGNWGQKIFVNTLLLYNKNHNAISSNTLIHPEFIQSQKTFVNGGGDLLDISSNMNVYLKPITSNLKLNLGYMSSTSKNMINDSNLRTTKIQHYKYGIELRSGFRGMFNYHLGTTCTSYHINASSENKYTDNITFIDLFFVPNKKINFEIQAERYYFGALSKQNNTYYFVNLDARYVIKKDKFMVSLSGRNLLDKNTFTNISINDINTSVTQQQLLPRHIVLSAEYKF